MGKHKMAVTKALNSSQVDQINKRDKNGNN